MKRVNYWMLEDEEYELAQRRVKSLLKIYKKQEWTKPDIEKHYSEWRSIAERLKVGAEKLDTQMAIRPVATEQAQKISNLYAFLLRMLGLYDEFFRKMYEKEPDLYRRAQGAILEVIK